MPPILWLLGGTKRLCLGNLGLGPTLQGLNPRPAAAIAITGVSRDSGGAALGGCTCTLFRVVTSGPTVQFVQTDQVVSDGSGNFSFLVGSDGPWRVTFDLDGAPVRAGITLKTLSGA